MNHILKITVQNFQSHSKTNLKPAGPGKLTVIVGPSDTGKTAIIRALRWLFYNVPSGTDFIRVGENQAKVTVEYSSGHTTIRHRSRGGINRYFVDEEVYEGFGSIVPLEIQEVTGVRPIEIGDVALNLNLAEQLDGPFLGKSISAPARARILGKLAGTEEIDHAQKKLGTDLFRARQEEKRLTGELENLVKKIKDYGYLDGLKETIEKVNAKWDEIHKNIELIQVLDKLHDHRSRQAEKLEEYENLISSLSFLDVANGLLVGIDEDTKRREKLSSLIEQRKASQERYLEADRTLFLTNFASLVEKKKRVLLQINSDLQALKKLGQQRQTILEAKKKSITVLERSEKITTVTDVLFQIEENIRQKNKCNSLSNERKTAEYLAWTHKVEVEKNEKLIEENQSKYVKHLEEAGVCPVCGNDIEEQKLKEVI